ncbi:uncharacterized protein A4U43_C04F29270 [Asparagus officinalis]|uniref:Uncharacterized protein n=1 Tax=Asparagus officinalis TaxID=4686 RepID=A0A5P1F4H9_ASPOF|nr:uncharacterized protein A4U43_C04F29270 [Asparagus officinalis]
MLRPLPDQKLLAHFHFESRAPPSISNGRHHHLFPKAIDQLVTDSISQDLVFFFVNFDMKLGFKLMEYWTRDYEGKCESFREQSNHPLLSCNNSSALQCMLCRMNHVLFQEADYLLLRALKASSTLHHVLNIYPGICGDCQSFGRIKWLKSHPKNYEAYVPMAYTDYWKKLSTYGLL